MSGSALASDDSAVPIAAAGRQPARRRRYARRAARAEEATIQRGRPRSRFWIEVAGAVLTAILATTTILLPTWAEVLFGLDADAQSGWFEAGVTFGCAITAIAWSVIAAWEWGRRPLQSN